MSLSRNPLVRKAFGLALVLCGGVGGLHGVRFVRENLKGDPLAQFRAPRFSEYPDTLGLRLSNVRVRRYVGRRVESEFHVKAVDVEKNRNVFHMRGIHDGVYRGEKTTFRFAAGAGDYNGYGSQLNLKNRVVVKSEDFDFVSRSLRYNGMTKLLTVAEGVRGKAWGGTVRAENVKYNVETRRFTTGPAMWRGKIPAKYLAGMGLPANLQNSQWDIEVNGISTPKGEGVFVHRDVRLSDKEVIIKAPIATVNQKTNLVVATSLGNVRVRYWSGRANFIADKVTIIRKEKRAILEGNVQMLVKSKSEEAAGPKEDPIPPYTALPPDQVTAGKALPKKEDIDQVRSGKSVREYPLVIVGDKVDYVYARGSRIAIITGTPQARQELGAGAWRQVWTNNARYDAENEILRLNGTKGKGDARMKNSVGDDLTANWFELSTAEGEDEYSGERIRGVVATSDDEDLPKSGSGTGSTGGGSTGGGSTGGTTGGGTTGGGTGGGGNPPPPRTRS